MVKIFVEGEADKKFLEDYVCYIKSNNKPDIEITGGKDNLSKDTYIRKMQTNTDNKGINLVIFDADDDFTNRKTEINKIKTEKNVEFELFLFPNNKDVGELENLLEKIINEKNKSIFECWNKYEQCLQTIKRRNSPLTTPSIKTKIYGYLEALLETTNSEKEKIKERNRDYNNTEHWNLDSEELNPLKEFLENINAITKN